LNIYINFTAFFEKQKIKKMKVNKIFLFILSVLFMLGIVSFLFPKDGMTFAQHQFYFPSLEEVLIKKQENTDEVLQRVVEMKESLRIQQQLKDSLSFYTNFFQTHPSRIHVPQDQWNYLDDLFERLEHCRNKNEIIHILHYGDSQIEGDRITGYIRQQLQDRFGGAGPGLIPAVQPIPSAAVAQKASDNMERYIVSGNFTNQVKHRRYGVLGQMAQAKGSSSFSITARNWKNTFENLKEFSKIRLYVGNTPANFRAALIRTNAAPWIQKLDRRTRDVNVITWEIPNPIQKFTLKLSGSAEIYGIAIDGNCGVAVDNIPLRGSSGTFFTGMDSAVMQSMVSDLNVSLIIMEFGGNMMPSIKKEKNVTDYKTKMMKQITYFQKLCPQSKILLIGPADMSTKVNGRLQTYPLLESVVQGMKEAAMETGVAFWNMYEVMGGKNSMVSWVKNKPALAAPDYIHFTSKGADKIAELFYESLMIYYDYYHFRKDQEWILEKK
jgi:lysophospholipase L1-like esterase